MATEEEIEKRRAHPIWTIFLLLALMAGIYSGIFIFDLLRMETGRGDQPTGMTAGLANWTLNQFWGDPKWTNFHKREMPENGTKEPPFKTTVAGGKENPHRSYAGPTFQIADTPVDQP
jgi:hypothetical protein